jgi:hypothetical protein
MGTRKHIDGVNMTKKKPQVYECPACAKAFQTNAGFWKHKKICNESVKLHDVADMEGVSMKDLVVSLLKQNSELIEIVKSSQQQQQQQQGLQVTNANITNTQTNTQTNTNSNNSFNLQFFLNETCKNAMNMSDFLDSIQLQLPDLISVGEKGFVEGISNIIIQKLNALDVTVRPVHCTDKKRETFYVKDENKWQKDNETNEKLRKLVKRVAFKNEKLFPQFKEKYPDYNKSESKRSNQYSIIVIESLGGDNVREKEDKIIHNIAKTIFVEKQPH